MADDARLADLVPEARGLVDRIAAHVGASDAGSVVDRLRACGSRFERGELVVLSLFPDALPELDVRAFPSLVEITAMGKGWKNKLGRVILGDRPRLKKLLLGHQAPNEIDLSGCTALVDLDLSNDGLARIELPEAPLEILNLSGNALASIDLSRHRTLARVDAADNRLVSLDVEAHDALRAIRCDGNPIVDLGLPSIAPLRELVVSRCPLARLDVSRFAALETLRCDDAGLAMLDLSRCAALRVLSVGSNPLERLDLRPLHRLESLEIGTISAEILCTERQKRKLPALRARFGIASHDEIAQMDLWDLDLVASEHNWDDGCGTLMDIVKNPRCDLGTALKIYWLGAPEHFADCPTTDELSSEEREIVELLRTIEARVEAGAFATAKVRFEGQSTDDPRIPAAMGRRIEGEA